MTNSTAPTPAEGEQDTGWRAPHRTGGLARTAAVGVAAAAILGGGLALAPSASAAPAAPTASSGSSGSSDASSAARTADVSPQGTAPACVQRQVRGRTATVTNYCGRTMRVKVVVKYGPDSRCFTLPPRHWARYTWSFGSYDKTVTC
ncbi:hypothetical protein ACFWZT_25660 [Streptomyces alboflavus]|uniref:hypothetical protein n=1 Tax=Streptomyces alboflavus TaxID=67267 RepID=UPI0036844AAE